VVERGAVNSDPGGSAAIHLVYRTGLGAFTFAAVAGLFLVVLQQETLPGISSDPTLRSNEALLKGDLGEAAREFRAFEAIVPRGNPSIIKQARLLALLGRPDDAFAAYERAARTLTHSAQAQSLYGAELFARMRFDEAALAFERVLALNAEHPNARENLAVSYLNSGRPEEAIVLYEQVLEMGEGAAVHDMLSHAHEMLGRRGKTLFHAERALQLEPENADHRARVEALRSAAPRMGEPR